MERTEPLKVAGRYITRLIREELAYNGKEAALSFGREVLDGATDEMILKIAACKAEIGGISPNTYYREIDDVAE
jgi:hypothetical protein